MKSGIDSPPLTDKPQRLLSLDAFRGLTILAMILVNNPGSWDAGMRYAPLDHAEWHGWTPTDLIFPFFLFIVGTSLAYSLRKYRQGATAAPEVYARILRRTAALFLLGVGMDLFDHAWEFCSGNADSLQLETLRYLGVLQRIALVYFAASLIVLHMGLREQVLLALALLLGYLALLAWFPSRDNYATNLSPEGNIVRIVDLNVVGASHMYTQAQTEKTEPEGLLSTFPAIVTSLLGYWAGQFIQRREPRWQTVLMLIACGLALAAVGLAWDTVFPINKKLWTSSFVLLTGGLGMVGLALCLTVFDVLDARRLARPLEIVGVNAITVYVGAGLMARLLESIRVGDQSTRAWIFENVFADNIAEPKLASLGFAAAMVAFWWTVAWAMAHKGWTLRA